MPYVDPFGCSLWNLRSASQAVLVSHSTKQRCHIKPTAMFVESP